MNIMTSEQPVSKIDHFSAVSSLINFISLQASAYEACNRTCTPLHTPKILQTGKKKSTPCLIKKASRCATDRTSKATFFQRSYEKIMRIYLLFH